MNSFLSTARTKETYLKKISSEPNNTIRNRVNAIKSFEKFTHEKYDKHIDDIVSELKKLKEKTSADQYEETLYDLLQNWINWRLDSGTKASTVIVVFSCVRSYLYYRGIKTDQQDVKQHLTFKKPAMREDHPLSLEEYRTIINGFGNNPKRQSIYLVQGSSGMRIGEILCLKKKDFDCSQKRIKITIPAEFTKTHQSRSVFISQESEVIVRKILDSIIDDSYVFHSSKNIDNARINEQSALVRLGKKLGGIFTETYPSSNTRKITSHSFRAYFFTKAVRMHGENFAHRFTGHRGYLMQYDRITDDERLDMYLKLEPELVVFDQSKNNLEISRLKQDNTSIIALREEVEKLKVERIKRDKEILEQFRKENRIPQDQQPQI